MSRARNWCFTINNPENFTIENWNYTYCVYQYEKGENETLHVQGYVEFNTTKTLKGVKKIHSTAHWEARRGSQEQAIAYCKKEDTRVEGPYEFGIRKQQGKRTDIHKMIEDVMNGACDRDLVEDHCVPFVKYYKAVDRVRTCFIEPRSEKPEVLWFYGATGTGKSREAFSYDDVYAKDMSDGKWFDGYTGQETVIFDDMRKDTFKYHELLRLLDRYELRVQYKGGSVHFNSKRIIITSCYRPEYLYDTREDIQQLLRRIDEIREFT